MVFVLIISSPNEPLLQKLQEVNIPEYHPRDYSSEGTMINAMSLDRLSVSSTGGGLDFLQNIGTKFSTLGEICQQAIEEKNMKV